MNRRCQDGFSNTAYLGIPLCSDMRLKRRLGEIGQFGMIGNMGRKALFGTEIHDRIADGQPDDVVAAAVGRKERVIRHHRGGRCKCTYDRPAPYVAEDSGPAVAPVFGVAPATVAALDVGNPAAVATLAFMAGLSLTAIAAGLGVDAYGLNPDVTDFGLTGAAISPRRLERLAARADALERMRLHRPAQWAAWVAKAEETELAVALDSRLPRETWTGFFGEIINHQSRLLTDGDMRDWIQWVEDLAESKYPAMAH